MTCTSVNERVDDALADGTIVGAVAVVDVAAGVPADCVVDVASVVVAESIVGIVDVEAAETVLVAASGVELATSVLALVEAVPKSTGEDDVASVCAAAGLLIRAITASNATIPSPLTSTFLEVFIVILIF